MDTDIGKTNSDFCKKSAPTCFNLRSRLALRLFPSRSDLPFTISVCISVHPWFFPFPLRNFEFFARVKFFVHSDKRKIGRENVGTWGDVREDFRALRENPNLL